MADYLLQVHNHNNKALLMIGCISIAWHVNTNSFKIHVLNGLHPLSVWMTELVRQSPKEQLSPIDRSDPVLTTQVFATCRSLPLCIDLGS